MIIMLVVIMPERVFGASNVDYKSFGTESATGMITAIKKNRIVILEDSTHLRKSFLYMNQDIGQFHAGERVRVYFRHGYSPVIIVKKLTPLEYNEKQNLGYIAGKPEKTNSQ